RLYPPACKPYGLEAEPEAGRPRVFLRQAQDRLPLRRTVQVRLRTNTLRLPGGKPIFVVSRKQFMKYPG
ncbi:MAG: hypothetical protein OEV18_18105, partial [Deltaproteobacteria bacterium]|nr:hypothetical protein [Deltaproteobacteria bacterium]